LASVPRINGKPIVGHHGIQNVLKRNKLSTYEARLAYSQAQVTLMTRAISKIVGLASRFFAIPPLARTRIVRFASISALSMFTTLVVLGLGSFLASTYISASLSTRVGLIFASTALSLGSLFFLYSLKYYLSLSIVLSFSQNESGGTVRRTKKRNGFLAWILGFGNGREGGIAKTESPTGLTPDIEHVSLDRYPKVSVQIPLYNEKYVVERAMAASTSFDYKGEYEVVLCRHAPSVCEAEINSARVFPRLNPVPESNCQRDLVSSARSSMRPLNNSKLAAGNKTGSRARRRRNLCDRKDRPV